MEYANDAGNERVNVESMRSFNKNYLNRFVGSKNPMFNA